MTTTSAAATHNGTCQACGRAQAFYRGFVAKHGYTVKWGYFHGVCRGAEALPLEQDKSITEATITNLLEDYAPSFDKLAADYASGAREPKFYVDKWQEGDKHAIWAADRRGKYVKTEVPRSELSQAVAEHQIRAAIANAESEARHARSHAAMLRKLIAARHGQPLMPIAPSRTETLRAGVRVQVGGKKGWVGVVEKMDYKVCSGCGPYMNGKSMLHAFLRSPKGNLIAIPARGIRASAILESEVAQ